MTHSSAYVSSTLAALAFGLALGTARRHRPPSTQRLAAAHAAGYRLALTHVHRGLLDRAAPTEDRTQ
ncbi:hypothetical protein [Streptomyces sp. NPDC057729]|uniref:hypothetical protein n=1 Tax=Streptomyces sp. NPDC057729 TaxID=3346230 RepID=UPI0036D01588